MRTHLLRDKIRLTQNDERIGTFNSFDTIIIISRVINIHSKMSISLLNNAALYSLMSISPCSVLKNITSIRTGAIWRVQTHLNNYVLCINIKYIDVYCIIVSNQILSGSIWFIDYFGTRKKFDRNKFLTWYVCIYIYILIHDMRTLNRQWT